MKRIVFLIVLLLLTASLVSCRQTTPEPPSMEPPAPTEEATSEPTTSLELVFFGDLGIILFERGEEHFAYILGRMAPIGPKVPPQYGFPLYIERHSGKGNEISTKVIASIPDPNIDEVGAEWDSGLIKDPDYDGFILRVTLTRTAEKVARIYDYEIKFYFSPDGGQRWLDLLIK